MLRSDLKATGEESQKAVQRREEKTISRPQEAGPGRERGRAWGSNFGGGVQTRGRGKVSREKALAISLETSRGRCEVGKPPLHVQ